MPRRLNAPPAAAFRHVMNRAFEGEALFEDRSAAAAWVARLAEAHASLPFDLHAYCLLPRHAHLLLRAEEAVAHEVAARLLGAAPRVVPVAHGRHLMEVSRYLHLNPVAAGLAWRPEDWFPSSLRAYLGAPGAPGWLTTGAVLGRFGTIGARHRYRAYVYAGLDPGTRDADGRPRWSALFTDGALLEDLAWRIEPVLDVGAARRIRPAALDGEAFEGLAREAAERFEVSVDALRSPRRGGARAALARGALVHAARRAGRYRLADVAAWLGYATPAAAAAAAERFDRALRASGAAAPLTAPGASASGT